MSDALAAEIRRLAGELDRLGDQAPAADGTELAWEHGWISHDEYQAGRDKMRSVEAKQEKIMAQMHALALQQPEAFVTVLAGWLSRADTLREALAPISSDFQIRASESQAKALQMTLEMWQHGLREPFESAWSWRHFFQSLEGMERLAQALGAAK